eukprot:GHVS01045756.1.p1 GENE.GHVS01045756.1~~GHVS01045756.1.p1  ORF type:complete len:667 (-),score=93.72 GHVS01045756.1:572-2572(-)
MLLLPCAILVAHFLPSLSLKGPPFTPTDRIYEAVLELPEYPLLSSNESSSSSTISLAPFLSAGLRGPPALPVAAHTSIRVTRITPPTQAHETAPPVSTSDRAPYRYPYPPPTTWAPIVAPTAVDCVSVVLVAHNEHAYVQRTLDSIVEASSPFVLTEIILIDDASSPPLSTAFNMTKYHEPFLRLVENTERIGLIRSKIEGAEMVSNRDNIIVFLDCHVRPDRGWLYPIIRHINTNYKRVVVPKIPVLDGQSWEVNRKAVGIKMMFDWDFAFHWFEDNNDWVPVMSGGLLAIGGRWWRESGKLDEGMQMWGAENIEQSIRLWLCGGEIVVARDSVVSHVFRPKFPYSLDSRKILVNKVRTAAGWLDEYKEEFFKAYKPARKYLDKIGDMTSRLEIKKQLQCNSFQWYVNRFKDVFWDRGMIPRSTFLIRYIEDKADRNSDRLSSPAPTSPPRCVSTSSKATSASKAVAAVLQTVGVSSSHLSLSPCDANDASQRFSYRQFDNQLMHIKSNLCLDAANPPNPWRDGARRLVVGASAAVGGAPLLPPPRHPVLLFSCESNNMNQGGFSYDERDGRISFGSYCLDAKDVEENGDGQSLKLAVCTVPGTIEKDRKEQDGRWKEEEGEVVKKGDSQDREIRRLSSGSKLLEIRKYQTFVLDDFRDFVHTKQ